MFSITGTYRVAAMLLTRWEVAGRGTAHLAREHPDLTTARFKARPQLVADGQEAADYP